MRDAVLEFLGGGEDTAEHVDDSSLTARQLDVLRRLPKDKTDKQIARELSLSLFSIPVGI